MGLLTLKLKSPCPSNTDRSSKCSVMNVNNQRGDDVVSCFCDTHLQMPLGIFQLCLAVNLQLIRHLMLVHKSWQQIIISTPGLCTYIPVTVNTYASSTQAVDPIDHVLMPVLYSGSLLLRVELGCPFTLRVGLKSPFIQEAVLSAQNKLYLMTSVRVIRIEFKPGDRRTGSTAQG